jgi:hypothetical protein
VVLQVLAFVGISRHVKYSETLIANTEIIRSYQMKNRIIISTAPECLKLSAAEAYLETR